MPEVDPFQSTPTSVGRKDSADSIVLVLRTMGTLEGTKKNLGLTFDGTAKGWQAFKQSLRKHADAQGFAFMLEAGQSICEIFQAASAAAAKVKVTARGSAIPGSGTISLDLSTYKDKDIEEKFKETSVITSVALEVRKNRKDKLGSNWADPERCGLTEDELIKAHEVLDGKFLREINRTLARTLHDAVFPGGPETAATTRLRSILKTPLAAKIIAGDVVGKENLWSTRPWLMESTQMWAKLIYRFEGMTEMINGAFMDDLGDLLSSITGQQRKTLYEIDQEFEKMLEMLQKNFTSVKSLMPFLRSSLRQTMIRKLSKVGKDKEAWKKAEEYLMMSTC